MRFRVALLSLTLGVLAQPLAAQTAAKPAASSPALAQAHKAACDALAAIVLPDAMVEPQTDRLVEALLDQMFQQDAGVAALETNFPGMRDALGAGIKPLMLKHAVSVMPLYRADLSGLYQTRLTTAEARSAAAALGSPAFVRFTRAAQANMNFKAIAGAIGKERDITTADVRSDIQIAGTKTGAELSDKDRAAVLVFMTSPLGLKLRSFSSEKLAIDTKWMNYTTPDAEKEVEAAVIQSMVSHIALTDPETAELMRKELTKPES